MTTWIMHSPSKSIPACLLQKKMKIQELLVELGEEPYTWDVVTNSLTILDNMIPPTANGPVTMQTGNNTTFIHDWVLPTILLYGGASILSRRLITGMESL